MNNPKQKSRYTARKILHLLKQHRPKLVQFGVRKIGLFGCKVDLVLEDSIKPRLRSHILSEVVYAQSMQEGR